MLKRDKSDPAKATQTCRRVSILSIAQEHNVGNTEIPLAFSPLFDLIFEFSCNVLVSDAMYFLWTTMK